MSNVSILVPVYNVSKYLPKCMDSILMQTLADIEIICINDGSTDDSGAILDDYAKKDSRVKVLHRANAGYGAAMNAGLREATGEYVGIVESDDYIAPEMFETLYQAAVEADLDLVKSDVFYWLESQNYERRFHVKALDDYYDKVLTDEDRNRFFHFFMNIWTGIYKRSFLLENDIWFHESPGASYQDNGFWMQTMMYAKRTMWLNCAFYYYRQDNPTASIKSVGKVLAMTNEYAYLEELLLKRGHYHLLPYCNYYRMIRHMGTFLRIADERKRDFCNQIAEDYEKYKSYVFGNTYICDWMKNVSLNADKVCEEDATFLQSVRATLEKADGIIIYGAGKKGDRIYRGLYNEGYFDKLNCFATTEKPEISKLGKTEVLSIEDAIAKYPNSLVIVAVIRGTGAHKSMRSKLEELGISEVMDGTAFEEAFYII